MYGINMVYKHFIFALKIVNIQNTHIERLVAKFNIFKKTAFDQF